MTHEAIVSLRLTEKAKSKMTKLQVRREEDSHFREERGNLASAKVALYVGEWKTVKVQETLRRFSIYLVSNARRLT